MKIIKRENIEKEIINLKELNDDEIINKSPEMKDIENKSLKELLLQYFDSEQINLSKIIYKFEKYGHYKDFKNIYLLLKNLLGNFINMSYGIDEFLEKIQNEEAKTELKNYIILSKKKQCIKEYKSKISNLSKIKSYLNETNSKKYQIIKKIKIDNENQDEDIYIEDVLLCDDIIVLLISEKGLKLYDLKSGELIQFLQFNIEKKILKLKSGEIMGKIKYKNYSIFINPKTLLTKKKFFSLSERSHLVTETSDEKIIMISDEVEIYSKINEIYILTYIISHLFVYDVYQINPNSIIVKFDNDKVCLYSLNDYKIIKYFNHQREDFQALDENRLISYYNINNNNGSPIGSKIDILNSKTYEIMHGFETKDGYLKHINELRMLKNGKILIGKYGGLSELTLINNEVMIENNLFKFNNFDEVKYINQIDDETICFLISENNTQFIYIFKYQ